MSRRSLPELPLAATSAGAARPSSASSAFSPELPPSLPPFPTGEPFQQPAHHSYYRHASPQSSRSDSPETTTSSLPGEESAGSRAPSPKRTRQTQIETDEFQSSSAAAGAEPLGSADEPPRKKRTRTLTTPHQAAVLYDLLAQTRFPSTAMREQVARQIGLTPRKVQIWFQNQRQKARRHSSAGIGSSSTSTPPVAFHQQPPIAHPSLAHPPYQTMSAHHPYPSYAHAPPIHQDEAAIFHPSVPAPAPRPGPSSFSTYATFPPPPPAPLPRSMSTSMQRGLPPLPPPVPPKPSDPLRLPPILPQGARAGPRPSLPTIDAVVQGRSAEEPRRASSVALPPIAAPPAQSFVSSSSSTGAQPPSAWPRPLLSPRGRSFSDPWNRPSHAQPTPAPFPPTAPAPTAYHFPAPGSTPWSASSEVGSVSSAPPSSWGGYRSNRSSDASSIASTYSYPTSFEYVRSQRGSDECGDSAARLADLSLRDDPSSRRSSSDADAAARRGSSGLRRVWED